MDKEVTIKLINRGDIKEFYPDGLKNTVRGWSIYHGGNLIAICGIMHTKRNVMIFSKIKEDIELSNITIWRISKKMFNMIKDVSGEGILFAIADPALDSSYRFLKKLGFLHIGNTEKGEAFGWVQK